MLKMEIAIPAPSMDFDFNNAQPLSIMSAPTTPRSFGNYFLSAPASPTRVTKDYRYFDNYSPINSEERNGIPFHWEEKPGTPKSPKAATKTNSDEGYDFAFDLTGEVGKVSLSAEELFDGGKIRPLKPPPRLQVEDRSPLLSPRSPRSTKSRIELGKQIIREAFSPRKKKDSDPLATAVENSRKSTENERGRGRVLDLKSKPSHRAARSLSPNRVADYHWEEEEEEKQPQQTTTESVHDTKNSFSSSTSSSSSKCSSRKWRLKDFLLFRSASEGRASDKDPFRKYPALFRKHGEAKNVSFRSTDSSGSVSGSRKRSQVSAHELHYTMNRAASEDLKKKTFLPYKQGILGRLAINPAVHVLPNGFGSRQ